MAKKKQRKSFVTIKLSVKHRVTLPMLFPEQSSKDDMMLSRDLRNRIELSKEERRRINFKSVGNSVFWGKATATSEKQRDEIEDDFDRSFQFAPSEVRFINKQVARLDGEGKITDALLDVIELFEKYGSKPDADEENEEEEDDAEDYDAESDIGEDVDGVAS